MPIDRPDLIDSTLETIAEVTNESRQQALERMRYDIRRNLDRMRRRPRNIVDAIELAVQANPLAAIAVTFVLGTMIGGRR